MKTVEVIQNHHSEGAMHKVGDLRQVNDNLAIALKQNGLVKDFEGVEDPTKPVHKHEGAEANKPVKQTNEKVGDLQVSEKAKIEKPGK